MSAQLRLIQGDHKINIWNLERTYRAKVAIPNDGFVNTIDYIGPWFGWKRIDPQAVVRVWSTKQ